MQQKTQERAGSSVSALPSDGSLDATLALLRDGYDFVGKRCDRLGTDVFRTRLMLRRAICFRGPRWTQLFYGAPGLTRVGAMPAPVLRLLQDKGSVQQLDGADHHHRKRLFTRLLIDEARVADLAQRFRAVWLARIPDWEEREDVCLLTGVSRALAEAACRWAGLSLDRRELDRLAGALFRMVDQAGRPVPATIAALGERRGVEGRLRQAVSDARTRSGTGPPTPLEEIASARGPDGALLPLEVAAVELLNVLRPIVAVGRYITFVAQALHEEPRWRRELADDEQLMERFCEEVRRTAPFFPVIAAVTREPVEWEGLSLPAGQWLIFDLYGTSHDRVRFPQPDALRPERGLSWTDGDDAFVPQGGGAVETTHRCPGEMATVALMVEATRILCRDIAYDVPDQDLHVRHDRIPAQPQSGFVITRIRRRATAEKPAPQDPPDERPPADGRGDR